MLSPSKKTELTNKHLDLVLDKNQNINLTSIKDKEKAKILHIEDSLASVKIINNIQEGELIDIGSGAGYPGIPLAIYTERKTTLVESVSKKADCLQFFIKQIELKSLVSVINDRVENYSKENRNKYQIVTARALSSLNSLVELASPLLKEGGYLLCYKSMDINNELNLADKILDKLGMKYCDKYIYTLSDSTKHQIIIYQKINPSKINLPRRIGLAQNKPFH